ncbi:MFS transporter [Klebsiella pneumoniae]|nr:MFS transporter [Klebsiella pneumoniae]
MGRPAFGVAIGALVAGPLSASLRPKANFTLVGGAVCATRPGRRRVAQAPTQLALMRFLTGLGLGAVMPNCVTLVAEYMPERRKGVMINSDVQRF